MTKTPSALLFASLLPACTIVMPSGEEDPCRGEECVEGSSSSGDEVLTSEGSSSTGEDLEESSTIWWPEESTSDDAGSSSGGPLPETTGEPPMDSSATGEEPGSTGEPMPDPICGNLIVEAGEACDEGLTPNCLPNCHLSICGDGFVNPNAGEVCDDGNEDPTDACALCKPAACGDGFVQDGEACDDGNDSDTDSCLNSCEKASCGDGFVGPGEMCDDGNQTSGDGCEPACILSVDGCGSPTLGTTWLQFDWKAAVAPKGYQVSTSVLGGPAEWATPPKFAPSAHNPTTMVLNAEIGNAVRLTYNVGMEFLINMKPLTSYESATLCLEGWQIGEGNPGGEFRVAFVEGSVPFSVQNQVPQVGQIFGKKLPIAQMLGGGVQYPFLKVSSQGAFAIQRVRFVFHGAVLK